MKGMFARFSVPQEIVDHLPDVDPKVLQPVFEAIEASPQLTWTFKQRALWVHGVDSIMDWLRITPQYSVSDRVQGIQCPTLVTWAENDPVAGFAEKLYDALTSPKTLLRFTAAEGAGDHCEMNARTLFHQRTFDWLDETLIADKPTGA
jgi:pimeloyl-ACP methyl ester carboxylesterase